jgi:hypothetical protein
MDASKLSSAPPCDVVAPVMTQPWRKLATNGFTACGLESSLTFVSSGAHRGRGMLCLHNGRAERSCGDRMYLQ